MPRTTVQPPAPLTFAQIRDRIRRPRRTVTLILDADAAAQVEALGELLERAVRRDETTGSRHAPDIARRLQTAEQAAEDSRISLTLQAISHRAYRELLREHPPTREQLDQAAQDGGGRPVFDPDSFSAALVEAQLADPTPDSAEEFAELWAELSDGQLNALWTAALGVQLALAEPGAPSQVAADILATSKAGKTT